MGLGDWRQKELWENITATEAMNGQRQEGKQRLNPQTLTMRRGTVEERDEGGGQVRKQGGEAQRRKS